jgi:DNA-binding response OmpR family regulator
MTAVRRILVVDDDPGIRDVARLALVAAGYEVETGAHGRDALRTLAARPFDLLLLDINMPVMDGWETLRLVKRDPGLARIPVVMFSVKSEFRDRIQGMQEGALDYVTKPFVTDELVARVRRVLDAAGVAT